MTQKLPVFCDERMVAKNVASFSPSAEKPRLVVADWLRRNLPIEIHSSRKATRRELCLAHDPAYVDGVLDLRIENGFGNHDAAVAASLPWTTGALMSAAEHAIRNRVTTCAPVSGFHHAHWDHGGGFCTFNGLMVTAAWVLEQGLARRVAIIDFDFHYGDGTDQIIEHLGLGKVVKNFTAGSKWRRPDQAEAFLEEVSSIRSQAMRFVGTDGLVLYQAGADQHILDPLGGMLTTKQMAERDRKVLRQLRNMSVPVAFVLAGGYLRDSQGTIAPVLEIHRNTVHWATTEDAR